MKAHARVVVIGGGIVGCSILYHLTKKGWSDVVLCERTELTAGSTWHAMGHIILFSMSRSIGQLTQYSTELYKKLEAETGKSVGFHEIGNLRLASSNEQLDEFKRYVGIAKTLDINCAIIGPQEAQQIWPFMDTDGVIAALHHTDDGYIAPADGTQALATGARSGGAEIYRQTEVIGMEQKPSGEWLIKTTKGDITCEHVVSATGNYARQTLGMVGIDIPSMAIGHQCAVTDDVPELVERRNAGLPELPILREPHQAFNIRQEGVSYMVSAYADSVQAVFVDGVPETFGQDLFQGEIELMIPYIQETIRRVPNLEHAGIKDIISGPMPYSLDGAPLTGPAWGLKNFWIAEGNTVGITFAGGVGWQLAEWIVEGEPSIDMAPFDPRRFGSYATKPYTKRRLEEAYKRVYTIRYPDDEPLACRPLKTNAIYDLLAERGAVFGVSNGWEYPNWFAPEGVEPKDEHSFRRPNYFTHVENECRNVRENVSLIDQTPATKFHITGPGAQAFLERLLCSRLPAETGDIEVGFALSRRGTVRSEFAIMRDGPEAFYLVGASAAERYEYDHLDKNMPADGSVRVDNLTTSEGVTTLVGPKARDLLARLSDADLSSEAFPWRTGRFITIGLASVRAMRTDYVGELGWEFHYPIEYQRHIFLEILKAGEDFGLGLCGARALNCLRMEKGHPALGADLKMDYTPWESGLDDLVDLDKGNFCGRAALLEQKEKGIPHELVLLEVHGTDGIDPAGDEPIYLPRGAMVGRTTSGVYGHCVGKSLGMGYVLRGTGTPGTTLEVLLLGERCSAKVLAEAPYDPANQRSRE